MKEGWSIKPFGDCIEKVKVTTKLQSSLYKDSGIYPIVSQEKELISGYWDNKEDLFCHSTPLVVFGDHTMVVKYIDFDFVVGADGVKILMPKSFLLPKFFYYWVSSVQIHSRGYARHFRYLKETSVPIPSLSEQQRIVDILDAEFAKIDALKENAEKNLQNAKDLFQAVLRKELEPKENWSRTTLKDACKNLFAGGDAPKDAMSKEKSDLFSIPIISNGIGANSLYGYTNHPRVVEKSVTISARGTIGYVALQEEPFFPIVRLIVAIPRDDIRAEFLRYALQGVNFHHEGAAIPQLTVPMVRDIPVDFPDINEQDRIVSDLDKLSCLCNALRDHYTQINLLCGDLKQALLRKAFNGEL